MPNALYKYPYTIKQKKKKKHDIELTMFINASLLK